MNPDEAAAAGALPGDVSPADLAPDVAPPVPEAPTPNTDLRVPGGATDALWYLAAANLAPHMESTRKRGWIDGFVAACEAFRGLDEMPDVTEVLRETVGQHFTPRDEAFLTMDAEGLARWLFYRAAGAYDKSPARLAETWADEKVQQHWRDEAESIIGFLANGE